MSSFFFITELTTVKNIGFSLFNVHMFSFLVCGFILLLGMVGAIAFTLDSFVLKSSFFKEQKTVLQILKFSGSAIVLSEKKIFNSNFFLKKKK